MKSFIELKRITQATIPILTASRIFVAYVGVNIAVIARLWL